MSYLEYPRELQKAGCNDENQAFIRFRCCCPTSRRFWEKWDGWPTQACFWLEWGVEHFWQKRYYDFNVRNYPRFLEKLHYIHMNPVRRGLCERAEDWEWSSFRHYATGREGRVEIESDGAEAGTYRGKIVSNG